MAARAEQVWHQLTARWGWYAGAVQGVNVCVTLHALKHGGFTVAPRAGCACARTGRRQRQQHQPSQRHSSALASSGHDAGFRQGGAPSRAGAFVAVSCHVLPRFYPQPSAINRRAPANGRPPLASAPAPADHARTHRERQCSAAPTPCPARLPPAMAVNGSGGARLAPAIVCKRLPSIMSAATAAAPSSTAEQLSLSIPPSAHISLAVEGKEKRDS